MCKWSIFSVFPSLSQFLCSFWWMTLSHRLQRSVYSLGTPQPRWINGRWECSNRALGSIRQPHRRCWERNTPPVFELKRVWMFVCASLRVFVSGDLGLDVSIGVYGSSVFLCAYYRSRSVDTDKSKDPASPNALFPSSASSKQRWQIITSLFFCLLSFYSVYPKCCCGTMWD